MFSKIKDFLFGSSPVQSPVAAPYKVEAIPAGTEASIVASAPTVEAVVVIPEAVVPAAVVEQAPAAKTKAPAVKKPRVPKVK